MAQASDILAPLELLPAEQAETRQLATARAGEQLQVTGIIEDAEVAAWLRAVGLHEGAVVTVLRKAPFGGPVHIQSADGGQFAVHRDLARAIRVVLARRR